MTDFKMSGYLPGGGPIFHMHLARCMGRAAHETLREAILTYLSDGHTGKGRRPMSSEQIAVLREYLRHWIAAPCWVNSSDDQVIYDDLARRAPLLESVEAIDQWIDDALEVGQDPL